MKKVKALSNKLQWQFMIIPFYNEVKERPEIEPMPKIPVPDPKPEIKPLPEEPVHPFPEKEPLPIPEIKPLPIPETKPGD
jgi:hypothetical protein